MADDAGDSGPFGEQQPILGGAPGSLSDPSELLSSEDILTKGRELALGGVPLQLGGLLEALQELRARAAGSSAKILPAITSQLADLRGQYAMGSQAIARRLGYAGGGQVEGQQAKLLAQTAGQFGKLYAGTQAEGFKGLLNVLGHIQPALSGAARPPNVAEKTSPFDASGEGAALYQAAKFAYNAFKPEGPTVTGLENSGLRPENIIT